MSPRAHPNSNSTGPITWDNYSLKIDGRRVVFWGGEMHPFRLPSMNLWQDIFEKFKANGFNVVQSYFHWGFHCWNDQTVDLTGIRGIEYFLKLAQKTGIYVAARPGPYINAETTGGGFALWTKTLKARSRTADAGWTDAWMPYISKMAELLEKYQYPKGPVIAVQVDNEFTGDADTDREYMALLEKTYKDAGIYVPLYHNYPNDVENPWVSGVGAPDLVGYDVYAIGWKGCPINYTDWKQPYSTPYTSFKQYMEGVPLFFPEFGGGSFDSWGGNGEALCRLHANENYERLYDRWTLAYGATMQSTYMTFGGTNWGNLRFPQDYTSYDYGAPITESRQVGDRTYEKKLLGLFLQTASDFLQTDMATGTVSSSDVRNDVRINPETAAEFHILRHTDIASMADTSFSVIIGNVTVPQEDGTLVRLNGRDSKILPGNLAFLDQHLVYSTADILTWGNIDGTDYLLLHGISGEDGEIVLQVSGTPAVQFLGSSANKGKTTLNGSQLRLNFAIDGLLPIKITGASVPLTILVADKPTAYSLWRLDTRHGPAFVYGSYLVRGESATSGNTLWLRGDTNDTSTVEVFASKSFKNVAWNGEQIDTTTTNYGSLKAQLKGPPTASVPKLTGWTVGYEAPEKQAAFDDSDWTVANRTTTNYTLAPPDGQPVLYSDDYQFHVGHVWYRGHFSGTGNEKQLNITVQGGDNSVYAAWLNGAYLGAFNSTGKAKADVLDLPENTVSKGSNVISILVDGMGSDEDEPHEQYKAYRGLYAAQLLTTSNDSVGPAITWKIQGNLGGENIVDPHRGTFNTGGKFGERKGWHLNGFPATSANNFTTGVSLPHNFGAAGVAWYFTDFTLNFPKGTDNPVAVSFAKPDQNKHYRAEFYINGWNYGKLIPDLGPQFDFPVPPGILNTNGKNHIAIAVHGLNDKDNTFADVQLKILASYTYSGPEWIQTEAPDYDESVYGKSSSQ
ncbi:glycoside hydrolase superfamily [Gongronella butleri]|nr:glycoside hydrolase superfamily [Gongronella butleri]